MEMNILPLGYLRMCLFLVDLFSEMDGMSLTMAGQMKNHILWVLTPCHNTVHKSPTTSCSKQALGSKRGDGHQRGVTEAVYPPVNIEKYCQADQSNDFTFILFWPVSLAFSRQSWDSDSEMWKCSRTPPCEDFIIGAVLAAENWIYPFHRI